MTDNEIEKKLEPYYNNWSRKKQIVTVFLRTHRRPHYVSIMIDSILKQTYSNFYLIVLDNLSGDNTRDVVESFVDNRIIYLERDSNDSTGITNFMFAFKVCKTKYLVVLHDDDILNIDYLKYMLNAMEGNSFTALSCGYNLIDKDGCFIEKNEYDGGIRVFDKNEKVYSLAGVNKKPCFMLFPSTMYTCSFFKDIELFYDKNAGPAVDQYTYLQIERFGGVLAILNMNLFSYR